MQIKISIYFDPVKDFHNFLVWVFKWLFKIANFLDDRNEKKWKKKKVEYENAKSQMKAFEDWNVDCGRAPTDFGEENERAMKNIVLILFIVFLLLLSPLFFLAFTLQFPGFLFYTTVFLFLFSSSYISKIHRKTFFRV